MATYAIPSDWKVLWAQRTLSPLDRGSTFVVYGIAGASLALGIQTLFRLRRCRREIIAEPSKRAVTFAACEADLIKFSKRQFKLGLAFSVVASIFWLTDAFIGGFELYDDIATKGNRYSAEFWLELAIRMVGIMAMLIFTQFAAPLMQMVGFSLWMQSRREKITAITSNPSLAVIVPEARTLSTYFMQFWSAGFFCLVAFWSPISTHYVARSILLQGVVGSVNAWSHMSYVLNWRATDLETLDVMETLSAKAVTRKCITGAKALYTEKADTSLLPQHQERPCNDNATS